MLGVDGAERRGHGARILRPLCAEGAEMGIAAHADHLFHREGDRQRRGLRQVRHAARQLAPGERRERPPVDPHASPRERQDAGESPQQAGLAGAVRPHDPGQLAGSEADVDPAQDVAPSETDAAGLDAQRRQKSSSRLRCRTTR